jgi:non-ribosomal peptide synthetase component E (peptide arylation enzyme)
MRLHDSLDRLAAAQPDLDFAIQDARHISYRQAAESDRSANALLGAGLRAGDRVPARRPGVGELVARSIGQVWLRLVVEAMARVRDSRAR